MSKQFLSQDEVDALLEGVNSDGSSRDEEGPRKGIQYYDIASQEKIVRGRMPTLEVINERFARSLRVGLFNFMRKSPDIAVTPVRVIKYSAFLREIVVPSNINVVSVHPLRGSALVIFDPTLVYCVIDTLFGGTGKLHLGVEGRDFSVTEQRIIQRMLDVTLTEYAKAWGGLCRFEFAFQRSEVDTQFANIASPSEIVVASSFAVELGDAGGKIHVCFPYQTLEPIRDMLYSSTQGEGGEPDRRWLKQLTQQIQAADIELSVELSRTLLTVGELLRLRVGDFVQLPLKEFVNVSVDGVPTMECRFGAVNGRTAVKIEKMLKYSRLNERGSIEGADS